MDISAHWPKIRKLFRSSFNSSLHYSIATVNPSGEPHVTPIGSLILGEPGKGIYFEEFTQQLPANLQQNQSVCVMAVNSGLWFWIRSLIGGRFASPPAIRLYGTAGACRPASSMEIALWRKRVRVIRFTRGHRIMWSNMKTVRELYFTRAEVVSIGEMTKDNWT